MKKRIFGILLAACMALSGPAAAYAADNLAEATVESEAVAPDTTADTGNLAGCGALDDDSDGNAVADAEKLAGQEMPAGMSLSLEKFVTSCADPMRSSAETGEKLAGDGEDGWENQEMPSVEVTDVAELTDVAKSFMLQRVSPFEIQIPVELTYDENMQEEFNTIMAQINKCVVEDTLAYTGDPVEGDYLRYQRGDNESQAEAQFAGWADNSNTRARFNVSIKYRFDYYTDAYQEQAVTERLGEVMGGLELAGKSNYEKVKAIHDFICQNVQYDQEHFGDDNYLTQFTAYGALIDGTAVCQGYSNLFYRMCLEAGVDTRIISGTNYDDGSGAPHAWNIVKMGDQYYHVDVTWDDPILQGQPEDPSFVRWDYFLLGDCTVNDFRHRDEDYGSDEFRDIYPTDYLDYERSYYDDYSDDEPSFVRASLLLGGQIGVNFFLKLPEIAGCDYEDSYMKFIVNGDAANVEKAFYNPEFMNQDGRLYGFTCHVSSIQMADPIKAIFHYTVNGTEETKELDGYTVEDYIIALPNIDGIEPEAVELANALANYGYHMQRYLSEVNGWSLGGEDSAHVPVTSNTTVDYSGDKLNEIATAIPVDSGSLVWQRSADIQAISFSLRLDTDISLKVFFTPVEGYTGAFMAAINYDEPKEIMRSNGRYCVTIPGIWAHRIGEPYNITVTTAAGDTELWLSALDYVGICLQNSQDQLEKNAMAAMYDYYEAAQAYQRTLPLPS